MDQARKSLPVSTNVTKLRNKALATRIKVQEAHDNVMRCLDHFANSHGTFLRLMDQVEMEALPPSLVDLKTTGPLLTTDGHALRKAVEDLRPLVEELKNVDYELFNAEPIPQYFLNFDDAAPGATSTILPRPKGGNEHDDEDMHPLLEEYFDLLGDIKLAEEQLEDWLPHEQAERRTKRQLRIDQGESVDESDEEFETACARETEKYIVELEIMNTKALQLRERCKGEGLDIDPSNHVRRSESASSVGETKGNIQTWLERVEATNDYAMTDFGYDRGDVSPDLDISTNGGHQQSEVVSGPGNEVELPVPPGDVHPPALDGATLSATPVHDHELISHQLHSPENLALSSLPTDFMRGAIGDVSAEQQTFDSREPLISNTTPHMASSTSIPTPESTAQELRFSHDVMVNQAEQAQSSAPQAMPSDRPPWFPDERMNRYYRYDAYSDALVYDDGARFPRPPSALRSAFQTTRSFPENSGQPVTAILSAQNQRSDISNVSEQRNDQHVSVPESTTSDSRLPAYYQGHHDYTGPPTARQFIGSSPTIRPSDIPLRSSRDAMESTSQLQSSFTRASIGPLESADYASASRTPFRQQRQFQQPWPSRSAPLPVVPTHLDQHLARAVEPAQVVPIVRRNGNMKFVDTYDQQRDIRVLIQIAPAEQITDPVLLKATGRPSKGLLLGTSGEQETLHSNFRMRPHGFFTLGRVFKVLWVEQIGEDTVTSKEHADNPIPGGPFGERVYSKVRRFVVIRPGTTMASVLPIVTYGAKGVGKAKVVKSEHAIIHTGPNAPAELPSERPGRGENGMWPTPIRVVPDNPADQLDHFSRVQLVQVSTVQHNVKVQPFGVVHQNSIAALQSQFSDAFNIVSAGLPSSSTRTESAPRQESVPPTLPQQESDNDLRGA